MRLQRGILLRCRITVQDASGFDGSRAAVNAYCGRSNFRKSFTVCGRCGSSSSGNSSEAIGPRLRCDCACNSGGRLPRYARRVPVGFGRSGKLSVHGILMPDKKPFDSVAGCDVVLQFDPCHEEFVDGRCTGLQEVSAWSSERRPLACPLPTSRVRLALDMAPRGSLE